MGNSVFAFDADNPATSNAPLWAVNLGPPVPPSVFDFVASGQYYAGIFSTPVIDPNSNTMFVWAHVWNSATQTVTQQLHALDITTGGEVLGGPVTVSAPGFDPVVNEQRAGLLLLNGTIYVPIGDHGDFRRSMSTLLPEPYMGMVLAYDETTLALVGQFNAEPNGVGAGIWQGGRGLASDGAYVFAVTANAYTSGTADYSENLLMLNPVSLSLADYFADPDMACLNKLDLDLSAGGPLVVPGVGTNLLMGGGKAGKMWVLQLDQTLATQIPGFIWATTNHATLPSDGGSCTRQANPPNGWLMGSDSAFWGNPGGNSYFYALGNSDALMSWQLSATNTLMQTSEDSPANLTLNALAVSANGASNGILWTVTNPKNGSAILSAYNAVPAAGHLALLWTSAQVPKRDLLGATARYAMPTIANGKVYVATGSNQVGVYGLLPTTPAIQVTPQHPSIPQTAASSIDTTLYLTSVGGFTGAVSLSVSGLPAGVTSSFSQPTVTLKPGKTVSSVLNLSLAGALPPLERAYTIVVQGTAAGGITSYAPLQLTMDTAWYTAVAASGCNSSNQMNATLSWAFAGSSAPSIWIQDSSTPNFPGRLWMQPPPGTGTAQTGYTIDNTKWSLYWLIDQSNGNAAIFDNAYNLVNLGGYYNCR
jgi:hypothetical protein